MRLRQPLFLAPLVLAMVLLVAGQAPGGGTARGDEGALLDFVVGNYGVVGKEPGGTTYSGTATITRCGNKLKIVHCIGGARRSGEGSIVPVTGDRIPNVIYHRSEGPRKYKGRYEIHTDIDNYARLSGPYVLSGADETVWGWEMLYMDPDNAGECR